jgi:PAS domain S-box-containing protein
MSATVTRKKAVEADVATIAAIEVVPTILEVVCRTTGMGFAAVARVTEDRWVACGVRDEIDFGLKPAGELKVETTICHEVMQAGSETVIDHVSSDLAFCNHPTPALYGFESYVSMPITLPDGTFFGTLCAIDPRPHRVNTPEIVGMFRMFAQLIGFHIDTHDRSAASERVQADNNALKARIKEGVHEKDEIWRVSQDMLGIADQDSTWRSINPAWTRILGWDADSFIGRTSAWLLHPDDRDAAQARRTILATGQAVTFEGRYRTQLGSYRLLSWIASPSEGRIYSVARDVTEERAREAALRDSRDFARLALASVGGVGVWTYDPASDQFFCDAAISELYGLDPVEGAAGVPSERFLANVHPADLLRLQNTMARGLNHESDLELEYRILHPGGVTRWVMSRGHTYFDRNGIPMRRTGVGIETTKQRELAEQLRQSQKMEAVGQLTGGLAHDFNNLLTGIIGAHDLIKRRLAQNRAGEIGRYVEIATASATRAAALTHRLLAFSRRQTLDPKPTDVDQLVSNMVDMIRRTVGPGISLNVINGPDTWPALIDPPQLENALLNLCINARDAMPDGGKLTIEAENCWIDARNATARDFEAGPYLKLSVSDTGTGMPPEVIARAFDPFFTTKPLGQGTGLGLSMIYGFAKQSGGQVRIHSQPGMGTTVALYLPRHDGESTKQRALVENVAAIPRAEHGETVLVVDDEPAVRMLVSDVLSDLGYVSVEAADGTAGLEILRSDIRIDLLVTDVGLPGGMNGRQVADAARVLRPGLKVLFITGYAENAVVGNGHLDPGMEVLTKPFAIDDLAGRIRTLIEI